MQETLGLTIDGDFGSIPQTALEQRNTLETAQRYCENRIAYRQHRVEQSPSQEIRKYF